MKKEKKFLYNLITSLWVYFRLWAGPDMLWWTISFICTLVLRDFSYLVGFNFHTSVCISLSLLLLTSFSTVLILSSLPTSWISLMASISNSTSSRILSPSPTISLLLVLYLHLYNISLFIVTGAKNSGSFL